MLIIGLELSAFTPEDWDVGIVLDGDGDAMRARFNLALISIFALAPLPLLYCECDTNLRTTLGSMPL